VTVFSLVVSARLARGGARVDVDLNVGQLKDAASAGRLNRQVGASQRGRARDGVIIAGRRWASDASADGAWANCFAGTRDGADPHRKTLGVGVRKVGVVGGSCRNDAKRTGVGSLNQTRAARALEGGVLKPMKNRQTWKATSEVSRYINGLATR
jgi:hypothetical protein